MEEVSNSFPITLNETLSVTLLYLNLTTSGENGIPLHKAAQSSVCSTIYRKGISEFIDYYIHLTEV